MQPLHERELEDARTRLVAHGRKASDFSFDLEFLEPDPDGGGMFTVHYEIKVANTKTERSATYVGGIGMGWVDAFEEELKEGVFD